MSSTPPPTAPPWEYVPTSGAPPEWSGLEAAPYPHRKRDPYTSYLVRVVVFVVVIVVVVGALFTLYLLVSCLGCGGTGVRPLSIGFGVTGGSTNGAGTIHYDNLTLSASAGLTTEEFGLKITTPANSQVLPGELPSACVPGAALGACPAVNETWYAVLTSSSGQVLNVYGAEGSWTGADTTITSGQTLVLLTPGGASGLVLAGSGDILSAYGTGAAEVSGQATL